MGKLCYSSAHVCLLSFITLYMFSISSNAESSIGVNYGQVADNLPPADQTVKLLQTLPAVSKLRMYGADPVMLKALANTGISVMIGIANGDIPALATDRNRAGQWVDANVVPFYPATNISLITVGNEVMTSDDDNIISQLVTAMEYVGRALNARSLGGKIKVSTVHSMSVLGQSAPPSSGAFDPDLADDMRGLLEFQLQNGSPLIINPYPYFAYTGDPTAETLAFCLFQPNSGRLDTRSNLKYTNMFDAQVDAVHSALKAMDYKDIEIVVAETGWPYRGDSNEAGASIANAKAYNGGLISHLRSSVGTPLMPGKSVDTYIFALYDEDLKPGPTSERFFGLYKPDMTMNYDVGLTQASSPRWCLPRQGLTQAQLQSNLDYACGQPGVDCRPIQPGGACYNPNNVASHAAFAMNQYYQTSQKKPWNCDFSKTAVLSSTNPSYNSCVYPGGSS